MIDTQRLIGIIEEQKVFLETLREAYLAEREGIMTSDISLLTQSLQTREHVKAAMAKLEAEREGITQNQPLRDICRQVNENDERILSALQSEMKVKAREVQALSKANILLFKQSLAFMERVQQKAGKAQAYTGDGGLNTNSPAGGHISSTA